MINNLNTDRGNFEAVQPRRRSLWTGGRRHDLLFLSTFISLHFKNDFLNFVSTLGDNIPFKSGNAIDKFQIFGP